MVGAIVVDPNNSNILYIGTRGPMQIGFASAGIFKSINHGQSWFPVNNGVPFFNVKALAAAPLGAGGTILYAGTGGGVYRSTTGGAN